jgi:hypothetical protein
MAARADHRLRRSARRSQPPPRPGGRHPRAVGSAARARNLGIDAADDKRVNYNAAFITRPRSPSSFSIQAANGNHVDYHHALSGR